MSICDDIPGAPPRVSYVIGFCSFFMCSSMVGMATGAPPPNDVISGVGGGAELDFMEIRFCELRDVVGLLVPSSCLPLVFRRLF